MMTIRIRLHKKRTLNLGWIRDFIIIFVILLSVSHAQISEENTADKDDIGNPNKKESDCVFCHNTDAINAIFSTPHAYKSDAHTFFAVSICESCHGESKDHVRGVKIDNKRAKTDVQFSTRSKASSVSEVADQNKICLDCHANNKTLNWQGSQHQFAGISCSSCHKLHTAHDPVLDKMTQADTCYSCHVTQRAESHRPSSHPINDGKMSCSNCHNVHGSSNAMMLTKNTTNETCYQCHAEKRGPFLWEHQPVREDCTHCHSPHGATHANLLKIRTPFLCNSCHSENYHPSTLRSGIGVLPQGADNFLLGKNCMNCHTQIHGSNHPSGTGLTR